MFRGTICILADWFYIILINLSECSSPDTDKKIIRQKRNQNRVAQSFLFLSCCRSNYERLVSYTLLVINMKIIPVL